MEITTHYLEPKGRLIRLRKHIPAKHQAALNRKMFRVYLKTDDIMQAHILALPIVAEWQQKLDDLEHAKHDEAQLEIMRLALAYERYAGKPLDQAGRELFRDIIAFLFQRFGGLTPVVQNLVVRDAQGKAEQALRAVERTPQAQEALHQIVGLKRVAHPFLAHLDDFASKENFASVRNAGQCVNEVMKFTYAMVGGDLTKLPKRLPTDRQRAFTLIGPEIAKKMQLFAFEDLDPQAFQRWIDDRRRREARNTTVNYLNGIRHYWNWCCSTRHAGLTPAQIGKGPLYDIVFRQQRNPAVKETMKYAFSPAEVLKLYNEAKTGHHYQERVRIGGYHDRRPVSLAVTKTAKQRRRANMLLACIRIKAYSSIRLGAICDIKVPDVETDPETGIRVFHITRDKSAAGQRVVPIHSQIDKLVDQLIADAKREGREYLIDTRREEDGRGGVYVSNDFTALKTSLGYDKHYSEHCIRKTVETQWEAARIPLKTRKAIIGHAINDQTEGFGYGKYGSPVPLADLKEAIEVLKY